MTKEEAIRGLERLAKDFGGYKPNEEMFEMAIEALKAQDAPEANVGDTISRAAAIDTLYHVDEYNGRSIEAIRNLPSAQPELTDDRAIEHLQSTGWMQNHDKEMYEMGLREQLADDGGSYDSLIPSGDTILRQGAIDAIKTSRYLVDAMEKIIRLPSAQPTLYGYNVEHLIMIAEVLRKENMPPERVAEALTDIGRIVAIVRDEFEKSFRKAVEQCMT